MNRNRAYRVAAPHYQRGAALLILLTIVVLAASYALLRQLNKERPDILRASDTADVLAEAKAALVGYALSSTVRPGELPCPDVVNNDGLSDPPPSGGNCVAYIGRLPWQTLGLNDLRDSAGERLWYTLDAAFDGTTVINSDTTAGLFLDGGATRYVAFVFAPGKALQGQARPPAAQGNVARYLEDDNANGDTNFITVSANPFNDQLLGIGEKELLQAVERRVLGELKTRLKDYFDANFYYPYPAALNTTSCDNTPLSPLQGHVPTTINASCGAQAEWALPLPTWFGTDGWDLLIWYALAPACTQPTPNCSGTNYVDVRNTPGTTNDKQAVLIAAGPMRTGQTHSPAASLGDLLDSAQNSDNADLVFEKLPVDNTSNDQILIVAP